MVFAVGKAHGFEPLRDWFKALYEVLLGASQGPRFGGFIALYGVDETVALIARPARGRGPGRQSPPSPATIDRPDRGLSRRRCRHRIRLCASEGIRDTLPDARNASPRWCARAIRWSGGRPNVRFLELREIHGSLYQAVLDDPTMPPAVCIMLDYAMRQTDRMAGASAACSSCARPRPAPDTDGHWD
jgi:hypothetical protein